MFSRPLAPRIARHLTSPCRRLTRVAVATVLATFLALPHVAAAQVPTAPPTELSDAEFWAIFQTMSEPGGSFVSENFVSNEMTFQYVIPTLQRTLTPGGVYLGVGPEQNFTYIANLRPRMAIIFDIRRQNAMQHLMYKALFELSPTRADFVARLFSRPLAAPPDTTASATELFDAVAAAAPNDSAWRANRSAIIASLTEGHGFALSRGDIASLEYVYDVFYDAGPDVNYGYRPSSPQSIRASYPTFAMLQEAVNADSVPMAFLATEENYRVVRDLQLRNLIVPVVGDFAGPSAIRSVAEYLRDRQLTVTAFYLSNVEQYLFRGRGIADRFYGNVATLPLDSTSTFIRSVPPTGRFGGGRFIVRGSGSPPLPTSGIRSIQVRDSAGVRVLQIVQDSAGTPVTTVLRDSVASPPQAATSAGKPDSTADSLRAAARRDSSVAIAFTVLNIVPARDSVAKPDTMVFRSVPVPRTIIMGGLLDSGLASIHQTLEAFFNGELRSYPDVVGMTKTDGWQ
ncbi:MAG TPA: hypothetical protein VF178_01600 [Gemmatimonadaceae bacterium]